MHNSVFVGADQISSCTLDLCSKKGQSACFLVLTGGCTDESEPTGTEKITP
jgi:hypothetical protein